MDKSIRTIEKGHYPFLLEQISDPPNLLYIRGADLPNNLKYVTFVGSRIHSSYGEMVCEKLISGLSKHPIAVVSGLAFGIDAIAHRIALKNNVYTVAVLGGGLSDTSIYPRTNFNLAMNILDSGGSLISEYEPDFKPTNWSFPRRNRIMAGLSSLVIVIEAHERSGTLITAHLALEYNRDVGAIPGDIFRDSSIGPNRLLSRGAIPIFSYLDILKILRINKAGDETVVNSESVIKKYNLSESEKIIYEMLKNPKRPEELNSGSGLSVSDLLITLSSLEIKDLITMNLGLWQRL